MIKPPTIAPGMDVKPPRISTGNALREQRERKLNAELGSPHHAGHQGDEAGNRPYQKPDLVERDAHRLRGLVIIGDRT
jgi:hypothetical protein